MAGELYREMLVPGGAQYGGTLYAGLMKVRQPGETDEEYMARKAAHDAAQAQRMAQARRPAWTPDEINGEAGPWGGRTTAVPIPEIFRQFNDAELRALQNEVNAAVGYGLDNEALTTEQRAANLGKAMQSEYYVRNGMDPRIAEMYGPLSAYYRQMGYDDWQIPIYAQQGAQRLYEMRTGQPWDPNWTPPPEPGLSPDLMRKVEETRRRRAAIERAHPGSF